MRKKLFQTLIISVAAVLSAFVISSCRKSSGSFEEAPPDISINQSRFFEAHSTSDPYVLAAKGFLKNRNEKFDFTGIYAERIGFPYWDKAIVMKNNSASGEQVLVFIPFVRDKEETVNSSLLVRIAGTDTSFKMVYASRYSTSTAKGDDGRLSAIILMSLNKNVFGYERFRITDSTVFKGLGKNVAFVNLPSGQAGQSGSLTGRMVYYTVEICYEIEVPRNNGYVDGGCPPDAPCPQTESAIRCDTYSGWYDDGGGGGDGDGGSTPTNPGGGGGGGGGNPPPPNPCPPVVAVRAPEGGEPCPGGPVYVPEPPPYTLSADDIRIFQEIEDEDNAADQPYADCQGTNRSGNVQWPGVLEHWLIMIDYLRRNVTGQVEYQIPGSSAAGNTGYADIADIGTAEIFEIKPNNASGIALGQTEVGRYVVQANIHCASSTAAGPWKPGVIYLTRLFPDPHDPSSYIEASLTAVGVIGYRRVARSTNPLPAPLPTSVKDKLKQLVQKLRDNASKWKEVVAEYLRENPDLVTYIKGAAFTAAVGIIIGTILEDIATLGGGIVDDWASFLLAYRIVRFAWKL